MKKGPSNLFLRRIIVVAIILIFLSVLVTLESRSYNFNNQGAFATEKGLSFLDNKIYLKMPYSNNNPLKLMPGETKSFQILMKGNFQDTKIKVRLINGNEIARISDSNEIYEVSGDNIVPINVKIIVPEGSVEGSEYNPVFLFSENDNDIKISEVSMKVIVQSQASSSNPLENNADVIIFWFSIAFCIIFSAFVVVYYILRR